MLKLQPSFTSGELSPHIYARSDLAKFATGCKTLRNFISLAHGGVSTRPGTMFVGEVLDSTIRHRLVRFQFSTTQAYILVFGDHTIQVIMDRGFVVDSNGARVTIETPYGSEDLHTLGFAQSADTLFIAHELHAPAKVVRYAHDSWEFSLISFSPSIDAPLTPTVTASGLATGTWTVAYKVAAIDKNGVESNPSPSASFTWNGTWTAGGKVTVSWPAIRDAVAYSVYKNVNGFYGFAGSVQVEETSYADIVPAMTSASVGGVTVSASSTRGTGWEPWRAFDNLTGYSEYVSDYTYDEDGNIVSEIKSTNSNSWSASSKTGTLSITFSTARVLSGYSIKASQDNLTSQPSSWVLQGSANNTTWTSVDSRSGISWASGEKRNFYFSAPISFRYWRFVVTANNGGDYLIVHEAELLGTTAAVLQFVDDNIVPSTSDSPQEQKNPFSGVGEYPSVVALHNQRTVWGGSSDDPSTFIGSAAGSYVNMNTSSPIKASDAYTYTLDTQEVNKINGIASLRDMVLFTTGAVYKASGENEGVISPKSINVQAQSFWGSHGMPPIVTGESALFVERGGRVVRDLAYSIESYGYKGSNLSILSGHLFERRRVYEWAHARDPYGVVWMVCDDGSMVGLTYLREHDVVGLHRHDTDGLFESVAVVPGEEQDDTYFIVKRTVEGVERRYVEVMPERIAGGDVEKAFCVDSGLIYEGSATSTLSGLAHLEGKEVAIYANGSVEPVQVVSDGTVTLRKQCTYAVVGLPYTCDFQSLDLNGEDIEGTTTSKTKAVSKCTVKVVDSRGLFVGTSFGNLYEVRMRDESFGESPIPLFTGEKVVTLDGGYSSIVNVCIRQSDPIPLTITSIITDVYVSEQRREAYSRSK